MKKLILLTAIAILAFNQAIFAQCTPDLTITQSGIYPNYLPDATTGTPYSQVLQVRVPADTLYSGQTIPIQSIAITNISGMPASFSYLCVPANCTFPGGGNGCVLFTGNPTVGQEGQYPILIFITATVELLPGIPVPIQDTITDYVFVINAPMSVNNVNVKSLEVNQNFPNPAINKTTIDFVVQNATSAELKIYNVLGKEIVTKKYNAKPGKNTIEIDVREFEDGLYMYSLKTGNAVTTRRMVIGKK